MPIQHLFLLLAVALTTASAQLNIVRAAYDPSSSRGVISAAKFTCSATEVLYCELNFQQCSGAPQGRPWLSAEAEQAAICMCWAQKIVCYTDCAAPLPSSSGLQQCNTACPPANYGSCSPASNPGAAGW